MNNDKVSIFNPLNKDIVVNYDLSGPNPLEFVLKAKEITSVPQEYAKHVKRTLADAVFNAKGNYRMDRDMQMEEIYKEIEIK